MLGRGPSSLVRRTTLLARPRAKHALAIRASLPTILLCATKCCRRPSANIYLRTRCCPSAPSRPSFPSYLLQPRRRCQRGIVFQFKVARRSWAEFLRELCPIVCFVLNVDCGALTFVRGGSWRDQRGSAGVFLGYFSLGYLRVSWAFFVVRGGLRRYAVEGGGMVVSVMKVLMLNLVDCACSSCGGGRIRDDLLLRGVRTFARNRSSVN